METLHKYLSSKIKNSKYLPKEDIFESLPVLISDIFKENDKGIEKIMEIIDKKIQKDKYKHVRIFGSSDEIISVLRNDLDFNKIDIFFNFENSLKGNERKWLVEDFFSNLGDDYIDYDELSTENEDYRIFYGKTYFGIYADSNESQLMIESFEDGKDPNPKFSIYYNKGNTYIELSSRKIILEIDKVPDNDNFWNNYDEFCRDKIKEFNVKFPDIEIEVFGRGGRHVCALPTMQLLHNYDEVIKEIERLQDNLLADAKDEADYWNDEANN